MEGCKKMIIEEVVINYLQERLDVLVAAESPEKEPESYVCVERLGRQKNDLIVTDSVALKSYGPTLYDAAILDEQVQNIMSEMPIRTDISGTRLVSAYNATDTRKKQYRYQCIFDISHK